MPSLLGLGKPHCLVNSQVVIFDLTPVYENAGLAAQGSSAHAGPGAPLLPHKGLP